MDGRIKPTAVRLDFDGQGAWRGFFWVFDHSPMFETRKRTHAMPHQNTVIHGVLKHLPWYWLDRAVEKYGADKLSRTLTTKQHVLALIYGQMSGATSLREIVAGLESHAARLYHVGSSPVKRSTLSDANNHRPWQVFGELCTHMLAQAHRGLRRTLKDAVRLIDSTSVKLSSLSADWATFSTDVFGAKAHIVYDPHADRPVYFAVTPAKINDITVAKAMPIETGAILRIVTNDLDAPATDIADLYKQRWQIELFFRWVKQTLRIKRFVGVSENAVRIQIAIALIAFVL